MSPYEDGAGTASEDPQHRGDVVDALVALGMDEAAARRAVDEDRVPRGLVQTLLGEPQHYTLEELADRGEMDAEAGETLLPVARDLLVHAYRRALLQAMSSEVVAAATRETGQELALAVGFVDLVGYTALSARIDPAGLDEVLDDFEQRVVDVVVASQRVTLVKFLGDAAMFVATEPSPLADVLLALARSVEELRDAPMRAGMAHGPTLAREGDYFGPTVNVAARLTDRARPWSLLADAGLGAGLGDELGERYATTRIRPVHIRGLGLTRPIVVSRPQVR